MSKHEQDMGIPCDRVPPCKHGREAMCRACVPVLRDFVGDGPGRAIAYLTDEKRMQALATKYGVPDCFFEDIVGCLIMQDMVKKWKNRKFVQHEAICQLCGTLKPHNGIHCRRVRARMMARGAHATVETKKCLPPLLEAMQKLWPDSAGFTLLIAQMKESMLDEPPHISYKRRKVSN